MDAEDRFVIRKTFVAPSGATWLGHDTEIRDVWPTHYALWIARAYLHNMADLCILGDYICVAVQATSREGWEKERKKTDNPREGWEDGTPPPHRDFKERGVVR